MRSKNLSFGFAAYGLLLLGTAALSFWANSLQSAAWLFLAGMGIMTWAHFLNRKNYWAFTAMLAQLFINATMIGWDIIDYFRLQIVLEKETLTTTGFTIESGLFLLTVLLLIISTKSVAAVKQELH